jgi:hypothetical protein
MRAAIAIAAVVVIASACPGGQQKPDPALTAPTPPALVGAWASSCFAVHNADGTDGFAKMDFNIQPATWALDLVFFAAEACATPLGTVHIDGPWVLERPSSILPGAFEARFDFAHRTVTPHVDGFIAFLQSMSCGKAPYAVGKEQDILEAGCPTMGFQPRAACPSDHDVIFVNGDTLQFGQRPPDNDMCTPERRPKALGAPLTRVP